MFGFGDVERHVVFEQAKLFEAFAAFEGRWWERGEAFECGAAVGVEAEMFEGFGGAAAVKRDRRAREIQRAVINCSDDFDGVGVGDIFGAAADLECGYVYVGLRKGCEERSDVFGTEEWLVSLDVDVYVGVAVEGDGVEAVGTAGEFGSGEDKGPVVLRAEAGDLRRVDGDEDIVKLRAGKGGTDDPGEEWFASEGAEHLARQARGGEACRDDAEDGVAHIVSSVSFVDLFLR